MWTRPFADSEVLASVKQGDKAALDRLLSEHRPGLYRYLCKHYPSLSPDDIEDAIQIASIQVSADIGRTELCCSFKAWFYSIAKHRCVDLIRKRRPRDVSLDESSVDIPDDHAGADDAAFRLDIERALASLPTGMRLAFTYRLAGLEYEEIARILGTSRVNVASDIHRARQRLEKFLQD